MGSSRTTLIIGVGNRFRCDDGVGPVVADRLRAEALPETEITDASGEAAELMDLWQGRELVVIVDAAQSGAPAGTIHAIEVNGDNLPLEVFQASTHTFGLAQAVGLARALDRLPKQMVIFGIEGSRFGHGQILSESVSHTVDDVAERIISFLTARPEHEQSQGREAP